MRYAILSDIQGNRQAWEAVAADVDQSSVDVVVCLGDVVGYGPAGCDVLRALRSRTENIVLGDHDAAASGLSDASLYEPGTRQAIEWNRARMDSEAIRYLGSRPLSIESGPLLFVHAEAVQPGRFERIVDRETVRRNLDATDQRLIFVGHSSRPAIFSLDEEGEIEELSVEDCTLQEGCRYLIQAGSVGEPGSAEEVVARYLIYDDEAEALTFRSVPFDADAYRAELLAARLSIRPWFLKVIEDEPTPAEPPVAIPPVAHPAAAPRFLAPAAAGPQVAPAAAVHEPASGRRRGGPVAWVALVSVLVLIGAVAVFVAMKLRGDSSEQGLVEAPPPKAPAESPGAPVPAAPSEILPVPEEAAIEGGTMEQGDAPGADPAGTVAVVPDPEAPNSEPEPAAEPEPAPVPVPDPDPEPEPAPKPAPVLSGPPPIPPAPENLAALTPITNGLMFYAPLDEEETEFAARDLVAGRELDATSARPGAIGRVGLACRFEKENGSEAMLSEVMPLPEIKALTISFWLRRPDAVADAGAEVEAVEAMPLPAATLVAIKDYCEVRFENNEILANLDREGDPARLAFPTGQGWHHVLVENAEGRTSIWIDHRSQAEPVMESLAAVPPGGKPIQIGSKGASFYIDEVALWNRAFSEDERRFLYRQGRLDTPIVSPPRVIAHWGFDVNRTSRLFGDDIANNDLGSFRAWKVAEAVAPDPVPLTRKSNTLAALVSQATERGENAGSFVMKIDSPFTYEGWVKLGRTSAGTLGGTVTSANEKKLAGWRLAVSPGRSGKGFLAFIYDTGTEKLQAVSEEVALYDGLPHHFAAVWNPRASDTHGSMEVFLDNKSVASATVPLTGLGPPSEDPFHIVVKGMPIVLDELRFSSAAWKPKDFLTRGQERVTDQPAVANTTGEKPAPEGETPMQRRARMARERRAQEKAERAARKKEEAAKRKNGLGN